ncbi:MAG: hypothetical protein CM15mP86_03920 [Gammaproteobacteria bacterium]|nr:MAG: hypothetical protein CM15mP86_03920 [Gammaproteobacteria bacterium]
MLSGARIDINLDKKNPVDFVLWKKDTAGMKWDSPGVLEDLDGISSAQP